MANIEKLGFFYGYMSVVNGVSTIPDAVNVFKDYDMLVIGNGICATSHPDYSNTQAILNDSLMVNTEVYGYIDATLTLDEIQTKIDECYAIGGVSGIFVDKAGYDWSVSREKMRTIVWCIHEKGTTGMKAFVNSWNPADVFDPQVDATYNPSGLLTRLGANDYYLAESFQIVNGLYDANVTAWKTKAEAMVNYRTTYGTKMAMTTTYDSSAYDQAKWDYAFYSAVLYNLNAASFGEQFFSASSASLPFRPRKEVLGTYNTGALTENTGIFEIPRNIGIHVDTVNHTATELLD